MADAPDKVLEVDEAQEEEADAGPQCHECSQEGDDERETNDSEEPSGGRGRARSAPGTMTDLCNSFSNLMSDPLYNEYDRHCADVRNALTRRRAKMQFKVNDASELLEDVDASAAADADAGLGVWQHGDEYQGDVNLRTLKTLLERIDQRGFDRSAHQLEFHEAFFNACSRVIYKADWEVSKPKIMRKNNWKSVQSEVMISCASRPRIPHHAHSSSSESARCTGRPGGSGRPSP